MDGRSDAERFLTRAFGSTWEPNQLGIVTFKGLGREEKPVCFWAGNAEEAASIAVREAETRNVYLTCCLRGQRAPRDFGVDRYGAAETAVVFPGVWLDIDMASPHRKKDSARLPQTEEDCTELMDRIGLLPSVVLRSGYGLQPWWLLKEPLRIVDRAAHRRAAMLSEAFTRRAVALARDLGWELDAKFSLATILRLPGTWNRKGGQARPVEIESFPGAPYRMEELEESCGAHLDECFAKWSSESGVQVGAMRVAGGAEPPTEKLTALLCNDARFRRTWEKKRGRDLKDHSQSGYEMSLANAAAEAEWSDQEIADLLIAHARIREGKPPEGPNYYRITIGKARMSTAARRERAEKKEEDEERREAEIRAAVQEGRESILALLRERLSVPLEGFVQTGSDPATYYLMIEGHGRILIGTTDDVLHSSRKVRSAVAENTGRIIPKPKAEEWETTVGLLFQVVEREEIMDLRRAEETRNWIGTYLDEQPSLAEAEAASQEEKEAYKIAFSLKQPFRENGSVALHAGELLKHIKIGEFAPLGIRELRLRLNELGFHSKKFTERVGKRVVGQNYWIGSVAETGVTVSCNREKVQENQSYNPVNPKSESSG